MRKLILVLLIMLATIMPCLAEPTTVRTNQVRGDVYTKAQTDALIAQATTEISVNSTITVNANGTVNKNDVVSLLNTAGVITAKTADNTMVSGIATTTATTGNPVTILIKGTATGLTGITQGANYYRQADYSIGTTPVLINGAYIFIGYGASSTSLILD